MIPRLASLLNLPIDLLSVSIIIVVGLLCAIAGFLVARMRYESSKQLIENAVEEKLSIENEKLKCEIESLITKHLANIRILTIADFNRLFENLNGIISEAKSKYSENYEHLYNIIIELESRLVKSIEKLETFEKQHLSEELKFGEHTEKVAKTEPIQSTFNDSKLPERVKRLLLKARVSLQTKDVSREVLALLPVKISRLDYQPIHHRILSEILDLTADNVKPTVSAISSRTHINKQELKTLLQEMINNGFIRTEVEGKAVFYFPVKSEFVKILHQPVFKTRREGGEIAFELLKRARDDWRDSHRDSLFITLRQLSNKDMPDAIIVPPLLKGGREGWSFFDAIAIEIETPEEIRAHPEQVLYNMVKNFAIGFKKVQFYCSIDSFDKLIGLSQRLPTDIEEIIARSVDCFELK